MNYYYTVNKGTPRTQWNKSLESHSSADAAAMFTDKQNKVGVPTTWFTVIASEQTYLDVCTICSNYGCLACGDLGKHKVGK